MIFLEKVHNQLALSVIKPPETNSHSLGIGSYWVLGGLSSLLKSEVKHRVIGLDKNKDKALCKAISGYVEMLAKVSQNKESDSEKHYRLHEGYAAYPALYPSGLEKCQENAYFEALEGFVWDSFWEDSSYGYTSEFYVDDLAKYLGFEFCKMIYPKINSDIVVAFAVGKVGAKGIVIGAGASYCHKYATEKACAEMSRNYLILDRFTDSLNTFDHQKSRCLASLSENGEALYRKRCSFNSDRLLQIPEPEIDSYVSHPYEKLFHVWRTRLKT